MDKLNEESRPFASWPTAYDHLQKAKPSFRSSATSTCVNRFRVLEKVGRTSYELATGHNYKGKLALFGETVVFKKLVQYKGSNTFHRGIWVGKNQWNDAEEAFEARTIRRLAMEESFVATDMVIAKGLPWSYSPKESRSDMEDRLKGTGSRPWKQRRQKRSCKLSLMQWLQEWAHLHQDQEHQSPLKSLPGGELEEPESKRLDTETSITKARAPRGGE